MSNQFDRIVGLIGEDGFSSLQDRVIGVIGLGGVGGTALEALVRSGFQHFVIVDFDNVDITNLNRQLLYTLDDVNKPKVEAATKRVLAINPNVEIIAYQEKISKEILSGHHFDFIVDAIDDVKGKILISDYAIKNSIPFIVSLGMANRLNPDDVIVTKINRTTNDPLAKKLRYEFKRNNIDLSLVNCVFSKELPYKENNKLFSSISVTSSAGLKISSYILDYFLNNWYIICLIKNW